ncbi:hypothetical protein GYMLUDRAFT_246446 [Collybiopsis luxurians FD-317 M1]|uniref:Carboxylesterase type B domain-containing protein n=1 Tax=Collybiopsis luxurians FD-317 M1 TaxID=944289 RepID=A0A0D0C6G1_9AGAR|nr:hypothetical protein GYMLUDRAFT_246446 [Collybiopsis luxurians FD-317 M1]
MITVFLLWYSTVVLQSWTPAPSLRGDTIVAIGYAQYLGNQLFENMVAYLGIPYAEPPLGDRHFRAPLPLNTMRIEQEAGGHVVDATRYPNFCVQSNGVGYAGGA